MKLFIAAIVLTFACVSHTCCGYKVSDYTLISLHLINSTLSSDPIENLQIASRYLEDLETKDKSSLLIASLRMFLNLEQLEDPESCNLKGYEILRNSNDYGGDKSYRPSIRFESLDRVNQIIRGMGRRHAFMCQEHYKDAYLDRMLTMDFDYIGKVNMIGEAFLDSWINLNPEINKMNLSTLADSNIQALKLNSLDDTKLILCFVEKFRQLVDEERLDYLYTFDTIFGPQPHRPAIKAILEESVFRPCDYYTARMSDIFLPLSYDMFFTDLLQTKDMTLQKMYHNMIHFRICNMMTRCKSKEKFLKNVYKAIKSGGECVVGEK